MASPIFGEFLGTLVLILLGNGVVAGVLLKGSKGRFVFLFAHRAEIPLRGRHPRLPFLERVKVLQLRFEPAGAGGGR